MNYNGYYQMAVGKPCYMLEHPSIRRYELSEEGRDNPSGADDQQETQNWGSSETARKAPPSGEGTVRPLWRHREPGRNVLATGLNEVGSNKSA